MQQTQSLYDELYKQARSAGFIGWGGTERVNQGPEQVRRILSNPAVPKSGSVLELGCGAGHLCRLLTCQGYLVTGVDISAVALQWAQEYNRSSGENIVYHHGDVCVPSLFDTAAFDLIVDGNCLHCIIGDNRRVVFANIHRWLKDNGIFFLSSLCSKTTNDQLLQKNTLAYRHIGTPLNLQKEIEDCGFLVLDSTIYQHETNDHLQLFARKLNGARSVKR
ncbi:MAG: class I SAM-dependent methyltransferase [Chitinivibrionales bacterium]|nr:class I SAM-dependent methyltransferase [Chitinivibrionales bacterium]